MANLCALLPGCDEHHLDHLAPLASIMGIPLVVSDEKIAELARRYYLDLKLKLISELEIAFYVLKRFDAALTCLPRQLLQPLFFVAEFELKKRLNTLWLPHGHSDKGSKVPFFEGLNEETVLFIYGPAMERRISQALKQPPLMTALGNFRASYFRHHADFYEEILTKEIRPYTQGKRVYLYAPTWDDAEGSSSLDGALTSLLHALPKEATLLIKPHPHSRKKEILQKITAYENAHLIDTFPPIYPLLSLVDLYIGDFSSIGYDFLTFDRPLVLLTKEPRESPLLSCSHVLPVEEAHLAYSLGDIPLHPERRAEVFADTFGCKTV